MRGWVERAAGDFVLAAVFLLDFLVGFLVIGISKFGDEFVRGPVWWVAGWRVHSMTAYEVEGLLRENILRLPRVSLPRIEMNTAIDWATS